MALNRIDVYCSAKDCNRYLYTSRPPIKENPLCDECKITQLRKELEESRAEVERLQFNFDVSEASNAGFKTLNYELRKALEKYGGHRGYCVISLRSKFSDDPTLKCTCGFDAALKGEGAEG